MIGFFGELTMWLGFALAWLLILLPIWTPSGYLFKNLAWAQAACICLALLLLIFAFLSNDFNLTYVSRHGNIHLSTFYKISATWSGHEGSLLLWLAMLSLAIAKTLSKNITRLTSALSGISMLLPLGFALFTSNPFEQKAILPVNGTDLNPLLQDPALALHPPLLFLGYVAFAPVFILMLTALLSNRYSETLYVELRNWTRKGWAVLTLGIALGSFWAYYELGWGGFWFWDPVESASLLPWFFATALLHALRQPNALLAWVGVFAIATFLLSLLATFLVRSGVLISVHSFATDNARGVYLLAMLMVFAIPSVSALIWRFDTLKAPSQRGNFYLNINNLLLLVAGFTVLLGTLAPIFFQVIFAQPIAVGAPYFNLLLMPLWVIAMMFFIALSWSKVAIYLIGATLLAFILTMMLCFDLNWIISHALPLALITLLFITTVVSLSKKVRLSVLVAHLGFFMMSAGIIVSSYFSITQTRSIHQHQTLTIGQFKIKMLPASHAQAHSAEQVFQRHRVNFLVTNRYNGHTTILSPEKRYYHIGGQVLSETAIWVNWTHDVLISLGNIPKQDVAKIGSWRIRFQYRPLVRWIWLGAIMMTSAILLTKKRLPFNLTS